MIDTTVIPFRQILIVRSLLCSLVNIVMVVANDGMLQPTERIAVAIVAGQAKYQRCPAHAANVNKNVLVAVCKGVRWQ